MPVIEVVWMESKILCKNNCMAEKMERMVEQQWGRTESRAGNQYIFPIILSESLYSYYAKSRRADSGNA